MNIEQISLNKFIADTGYCSRREADNLITQGRVLINNKTAKLGYRIKQGDIIEVDGSYITQKKVNKVKEKLLYIAFNKPVGITCTTEENVKGNIITFINHPKRIFPVGRLDKDSEGLILLTNDGDIVNKILRAENHHDKEYIVKVNKPLTPTFTKQMGEGVKIKEGKTLPCVVKQLGSYTFKIILNQGLNRQIRKMCAAFDYEVVGLQRIRVMNIKLKEIAVGKWRYLSEIELQLLMDLLKQSDKSK